MKHYVLRTLFLVFVSCNLYAQVGINSTGSAPHNSAMLDVSSSSRGFLPPRLSTIERNAIPSPADGLIIYNTTNSCLEFFTGSNWFTVSCGCSGAPGSPAGLSQTPGLNQIAWSWAASPTAQGYKYNTINNYSTSVDLQNTLSHTLVGLNCGVSYNLYVWAYNACGVSAPLVLTAQTLACPFVCGTGTVTDIDNNVYATVQIGTQCWMAANLNTTRDANGTAITRYCYGNNVANCTTYGGHYQWATVMNGAASSSSVPSGVQGICPNGWHLPSDGEWCQLENFAEPGIDAGCSIDGARGTVPGINKLKSATTWGGGLQGTNETGFSLLGNGYRDPGGVSSDLGGLAYMWSSTQFDGSNAWRRNITTGSDRGNRSKLNGAGVRCVKN
jgi:uncharacterized protein (TIGR02145 family)